jgi:hypothetical protein
LGKLISILREIKCIKICKLVLLMIERYLGEGGMLDLRSWEGQGGAVVLRQGHREEAKL